jgi:hypothetical protein
MHDLPFLFNLKVLHEINLPVCLHVANRLISVNVDIKLLAS